MGSSSTTVFASRCCGALGLPVAEGLSYERSVDEALDALAAALEEHLELEAMFG